MVLISTLKKVVIVSSKDVRIPSIKGDLSSKPMLLVTTTGYIEAVLDLNFANGKNNDAALLKAHMKTEGLQQWLSDGDIRINC